MKRKVYWTLELLMGLLLLWLAMVRVEAWQPVPACSPLQYHGEWVYYKQDGAQEPACGMPSEATCQHVKHWSGAEWWLCSWPSSVVWSPVFVSPVAPVSPIRVEEVVEEIKVDCGEYHKLDELWMGRELYENDCGQFWIGEQVEVWQ